MSRRLPRNVDRVIDLESREGDSGNGTLRHEECDRRITRSASDEIRMAKALGVVEYGNAHWRYAEEAALVRARQLFVF